MNTQLALANPGTTDTQATLTFETATGAQTQLAVDVPARSRRTVDLSTVPELAGQSFSTRLESDQRAGARSPHVAERGRRRRPASRRPSTSRRRRGTSPKGSTVDPRSCSTWCRTRARRRPASQVRYLLPNGAAPVDAHLHRRRRQPRDDLGGSRGPGAGRPPTSRRRSPRSTARRSSSSAASTCARPARRRRAAATPAPASRLRPPSGSSKARRAGTRRGCSSPTRARRPPQVQRDLPARRRPHA